MALVVLGAAAGGAVGFVAADLLHATERKAAELAAGAAAVGLGSAHREQGALNGAPSG